MPKCNKCDDSGFIYTIKQLEDEFGNQIFFPEVNPCDCIRPTTNTKQQAETITKAIRQEEVDVSETYTPYKEVLKRKLQREQNSTQSHTSTQTTGKNMSNTDKLKAGGSRIAKAVQRGAVQGSIGAVNRRVVRLLEEKMGDNYPDVLKTEAGRKAVEALIPSFVLMVCAFDEGNKIPKKEYIEAAAEFALTDASADAIDKLLTVFLQEALPILQSYAKAGKMLEEKPDFTQTLEQMMAESQEAVIVEEF